MSGIPLQTPSLFQNLHIDIHLSVIQCLKPSDVVSLSMTCRSLREASIQRSVWIPLLNNACAFNALFKPTYRIAQMSVLEIQRVVFSPARMIALYNKHLCSNNRLWPATSDRFVLPGVFDTAGNFTRYLFLIPGGRFLVSYSGYWRRLCVWDLDDFSKHPTKSQPLVQWRYRLQTPISCSQNASGTAIRIGALANPISEELSGISQDHVFEYQPGLSTPTTRVYNKNVPQYTDLPMIRFLSGNIFIEIDTHLIHMWDIIRNRWLCWKHGEQTARAALLDHERVILIGLDWIRGWNLPEYRAWVPFDRVTPIDLIPEFIIPIHQPSNPSYHLARNHLSVYKSASSWYSGLSITPFLFDIIESGSSSEYFTVCYGIHTPSDSDAGSANGRIDERATALIQDLNYGDFSIGWDSWRVLDGQLFKCFSNFDTIQLVVSGDRVTQTADKVYSYYDPVVSLENTGEDLLQCGEFSFDPISGRLCYASLIEEGSIIVMDFLPPRNQ